MFSLPPPAKYIQCHTINGNTPRVRPLLQYRRQSTGTPNTSRSLGSAASCAR